MVGVRFMVPIWCRAITRQNGTLGLFLEPLDLLSQLLVPPPELVQRDMMLIGLYATRRG